MKVILTAGHELSGFEQVHQALVGAGVAQALPSKRDALNIKTLQQNMLTALDVNAESAAYQLKPGKMWQDLAADVFLGNLQQKIWGHADAHTVWLLDFWKTFDTQTHFVLVYNSPAQVIANALARDSSLQTIGAVLNKWKSDNTELLRFYHRNKDRALLVHINSIVNTSTNTFIQSVNESFGVSLNDAVQQAAAVEQVFELAALIADQAILQHADLVDCYLELESAADLPAEADGSNGINIEKVCAEFAALKAAIINNKQLQIELNTAQEKSIEIAQVQGELQQHNLALSGDLVTLTEERDLLVLQLHQVQQELESIYLSHKSIQQENAEFKLAIENVSTTNAQLKQALLVKTEVEKNQEIVKLKEKAAQLEQSIASHSEVNAAQEKLAVTNKSLTEENNVLLLQLHQVQEELENYYLKCQALSAGDALQKPTSDSFVASFWKKYQPDQITIDLRTDFLGDNWYDPEQDGTWAGPALKSTLKIPALCQGEYTITFVVADAMAVDIVSTMVISLNGVPLTLNIDQLNYPINVTAHINTNSLPHDSVWLFELSFAKNVSPADCDSNNHDHRLLAIKLQQLILNFKMKSLSPVTKSLAAPVAAAAVSAKTRSPFIVKMNESIKGTNWHEAEHDGRWAGPGTLSTVIIPGLASGQYDINLNIVDTIEPDVLAGMELLINGSPVPLSFDWSQFPAPITARFSSEQIKPQAEWELGFRFSKTVAPAEQSSANQDHRKLAVRVQSIAFTPV
jgi:hypothetical protein